MEKIIITTPDELKALVKEAVHGLLPAPAEQKNDTDAANLVEILAFLKKTVIPHPEGRCTSSLPQEISRTGCITANLSFHGKRY